MTKLVLSSVGLGIFIGYKIAPEIFLQYSGTVLMVGLCILLFLVGVDIGIAGTAVKNIKKAGIKIFIFPVAIMIGTFVGALVASICLPISVKDSLMVGAGFGWYSLAPVLIANYSAKISAISFMHNIFREILGMIVIPFVARRIGYIETTSLPGAAAMDVCLPLIEKETTSDIAIYSFISGLFLSMSVPILVPFIINL